MAGRIRLCRVAGNTVDGFPWRAILGLTLALTSIDGVASKHFRRVLKYFSSSPSISQPFSDSYQAQTLLFSLNFNVYFQNLEKYMTAYRPMDGLGQCPTLKEYRPNNACRQSPCVTDGWPVCAVYCCYALLVVCSEFWFVVAAVRTCTLYTVHSTISVQFIAHVLSHNRRRRHSSDYLHVFCLLSVCSLMHHRNQRSFLRS